MKARSLGGTILILLAGWWVYQPALHGGWLWDDLVDVVQNPVIHDPAGWWKIWLAPVGWHFFPLKSTVQWAQWQSWQHHTTGYHVTNLALHLAGAFLLWRVLSRLGVRNGWLGALLFTVHPLAVESVAWIAELKNTLSLPLLLLAALAWLDYDEAGRERDLVRSIIFFAAAMLAKTSVVMFPVVLLFHGAWRHGRLGRRTLLGSLPFFAVSAGLGFVTVAFEGRQHPAVLALMPAYGAVSRLAGAGGAIGFYLLKALVPTGLSPVYAEWPLATPSPEWFLPWLALVVVSGLIWARWASWGRPAALGLGFFLLNLAPVLGFVPMAYHHIAWVADHFVYLPLLGLAGLAAAAADGVERHLAGRAIGVVPTLGIAAAAVLAATAHRYAAVFHDEESLWTHAVTAQPDAWLAHHNLAYLLARTQRTSEAVEHYRIALQLKPGNADGANNLGNALLAQDRGPEAIAAYEQAIRARPDFAEAHANLGNALARSGRRPEAIAACTRALALDPGCLPAEVTLGDLLAQDGLPAEAAQHYAAALRLHPDDPVVLNNQGTVLLQLGRSVEARAHYEKAVQLAPDYVAARVNLGYAMSDAGRIDDAATQWKEALRLASDNLAALAGLGDLLVKSGRPSEAEARYRSALLVQPDDAELHNNLAYALALQGRTPEAIQECEEALRLRPDYAAARENLARLKR